MQEKIFEICDNFKNSQANYITYKYWKKLKDMS